MPVNQCRCVPEQQRERQVQGQRDPHRQLKIGLLHNVLGDFAAQKVKPGKPATVYQGGDCHDD